MNKLFNDNKTNALKEIKEELIASNLFDFEINDYNCLSLYQTYNDIKACECCPGLDKCPQATIGYHPIVKNNEILYSPCKLKRNSLKQLEERSRIDCLYMPKKVFEANLDDYRLDSEERIKCYKYAKAFIDGDEKKGMFIYGPFGVGKTFLLACLMNELAKKGKSTVLVYFPDLARDMKSSIDQGNLEKKIEMLKTVDVLLIDDIGSENMSAWIRDEILSPILNYRYLDELPTFFSSNLDYKQLAEHLSNTKDGKDMKKGPRIVQRIICMTKKFGVEQ